MKVPLLNFEGGSGSRGPGSWGPGSTFTPCRNSHEKNLVAIYLSNFDRSSQRRCFVRNGVLRNLQNSQEIPVPESLF